MHQRKRPFFLPAIALFAVGAVLAGCEVDSFFDPSKPFYGQQYASSTPILERIDAIERGSEQQWGNATEVQPEDLLPSDLEYELSPGDVVTVEIFELLVQENFYIAQRRIDTSGNLRLPSPIRDHPAAGKTPRELEDSLIEFLDPEWIRNPIVSVWVDAQQGAIFTVAGSVPQPGTYPLVRPDLRLDQALGFAGGVAINTEYIYIVRPVTISSELDPFPREPRQPDESQPDETAPVDIDELIPDVEDEDEGGAGDGGLGSGALPEASQNLLEQGHGQLQRLTDERLLDIDDFNPRGRANAAAVGSDASFVYIEERGWVAVHAQAQAPAQEQDEDDIVDEMLNTTADDAVLERVIRVPYRKMLSDNSYNIVVRPGDRIYVDVPPAGVVYIGGEVLRPGVYQLPPRGRLTLSQLVTAAGGFGPLAIPSRVDFTRRVGADRDATIRLNLGAIRQKTEPDIFIKPDDHIIIGTNWIAAPLAVIRNGFRATYGFGFLLDRNFGNDVFGAPPIDRLGRQQ